MKDFSTVIINAGGKSSRMGFNKAFVEIEDDFLIKIMINELKKSFEDIILVTNETDKFREYKEYKEYVDGKETNNQKSIIIIEDEIKSIGPIAGLYTGLRMSSSKHNFFIACDMPVINIKYISYMKQKLIERNYDAVVTNTEYGIEPYHGFYNKNIESKIRDYLKSGNKSLHSLLNHLNVLYIDRKDAEVFEENLNFFTNINDKYELANYLRSRRKDETNGINTF